MSEQKQKIAIFVDSRKESGGEYQHLLYTIRNIKKNNKENYKFLIICTSMKLNLNLEGENLELHYFSMNAIERYICYLRNFGPLIRRLKKYFFIKNKFESFLKKKNVDLVYFLSPSQYSLYLEDTKFFITVPDVDHREHLEFPEVVGSSEFERKNEILAKALPKALAVITNADIIKRRLCSYYNISSNRIYIIALRPALSVENFSQPDLKKQNFFEKKFKLPKKYIYYPGMYLPHKNHKNLIDALKIMKDNFNLKINVVFSGSDIGYKKNLINYANKLGIQKDVIFLDFVEDEALPYLYKNALALVNLQLIGPTAIPPFEAFKMNVPVIVSEIEGVKELYGDAVFYVNPMSPQAIAAATKEVLENNDLRSKLVKSGKKISEDIKGKDDYSQIFKIINDYRRIKSTWVL